MNTYTVRIKVEKSYDFEDTIEAESEIDAEDVAKSRLWNGDYQREERACAEITDETYNAEEQEEIVQCEICHARYSNSSTTSAITVSSDLLLTCFGLVFLACSSICSVVPTFITTPPSCFLWFISTALVVGTILSIHILRQCTSPFHVSH